MAIDTTNFLIAVIIMMLAASYDAYWLAVGVAIIMMLTMRSLNSIVLLLLSLGIVVFFRGSIQQFAPYILFGLIILAMALGNSGKQPEPYPPDLGLGGMEGLGGLPPY